MLILKKIQTNMLLAYIYFILKLKNKKSEEKL